ncbi:MAG: S1-C subfamily serine protease [Myxococcota bacterium]|jgi:S1-C subfamily serine protease
MSWTTLSDALADAVEQTSASVLGVRSAGRGPISGVAWDERHVITVGQVGREATTAVRDPSGARREARVVGRARRLGLTLLEVDGGLTPARWGESDSVRVGHLVVATGRVRGDLHASLGMVGRVGGAWRTRWGGTVDRYLDVDGGLPPGGSGGALVGHTGEVVGLNTAGLVRGGTTLPVETLRRAITRMLSGGATERAYLGTSFIPVELPPAVAEAEGRERALLAVAIEPGGPSDVAGLKLGDVLLALGESTFDGLPALLGWLGEHPPGEAVEARLIRGGVETRLSVTPTRRGD